MKAWVDSVLDPYIQGECQRLGLPSSQKAILTLDCWSVHRGKDFREWMKRCHPSIILLFVPGSCTSVAQPCDTRINRVLKHSIKKACIDYLAQETQAQLSRGIPASKVQINTSPASLRNASTEWLLTAWTWFQERPEIVLGAWKDTKFGDWDLSYDTLTSPCCQCIVEERFQDDQSFSLAITAQLPENPEFVKADSPNYDDDYAIDPALLPSIHGALP
ncbi:DDE superfamily endonuclease [Ceratobasidium sp. AG-Ba]|nr:DDE superfamily endonuclease [Ceratobasidium sp. AG-Ba]